MTNHLSLTTCLFHSGRRSDTLCWTANRLGKVGTELVRCLQLTMMERLDRTMDIRFQMDRKLGRVGKLLEKCLRLKRRMCQLFLTDIRLDKVGIELVKYPRSTKRTKHQQYRMGIKSGKAEIELAKYLKSQRKKKTRHQFHSQCHSGSDIRSEKALDMVGK